jgi:hypothetical protein
VQVTYHAARRDGVLAGQVLPWLDEQPADAARRWSALDLSVQVPSGYELASHQLSAGDLRLSFVGPGRRRIEVRQIGPATLALSRQGLDRWLKSSVSTAGRVYRSGAIGPYALDDVGRRLEGLRVERVRRPWAVLRRSLMPVVATLAVHDPARNRLVFVQAGDAATAEAVLRTVGWHARDDRGDGVK